METGKQFFSNVSKYSHFFMELMTLSYVFIFNVKYDIYFLLYMFLISTLKLLNKYECLWSVFDKKLDNPNYILGSKPHIHPFRDLYIYEDLTKVVGIVLLINFAVIFYRNKNVLIKIFSVINLLLIMYIEYKIHEMKNK